MKSPPVILFAGDTGWRLARGESLVDVPASGNADPAHVAHEVSALLGSSSPEITLAVPASWCLSATVSLDGIPARNRQTALLYRLEQALPLTAEDIAADYILNEPESALAICVSTSAVKPFVEAIEETEALITSIVPCSVYATKAMLPQYQNPLDAMIWQAGDVIEIFGITKGVITGWYVFPASEEDLCWQCGAVFGHRPGPATVVSCNLSANLVKALQTIPSVTLLQEVNRSIEQCTVSAVVQGIASPIELRRGTLAPASPLRAIRKPLKEFAVAVVILIFCICVASIWRAGKLETLAAADRAEQERLFRQTFPGHAVPVNIVSRLRSEERKLQSGQMQTDAALPETTLPALRSVLIGIDGLPTEVRLEVNSLKVDDDRLALDAFVRNRTDLTTIVDQLQEAARLHLDTPQTEQIAGKGLHIIVTGSSISESKAK